MKEDYPRMYLYKRIVEAKRFMDEHYGDAIDLGNISNNACFSRFHFIRLFRTIYGKTPHQYLTKVRIDHAKKLLRKEIPVTETCFIVGFSSIGSFTLLFKRHTSLSPSRYQQQCRKRQEELEKSPLKFIPGCFALQQGWM